MLGLTTRGAMTRQAVSMDGQPAQQAPGATAPSRRLASRLALGCAGSLLWLIGAASVQAKTIYEWREPGGTVAYSQFPPELNEGRVLRQIDVQTLAPEGRRAAARSLLLGPPPTGDVRAWQAADERVAKALAVLQQAERALREGAEPQPGERQHLANGHSKLTGAYFDRIASEERAISHARVELDAAYAARDALSAGTAQR
jgi:hypothetical protein